MEPGYTVVVIAALALVLAAIAARSGRREIGYAAGLCPHIVQTMLLAAVVVPDRGGTIQWALPGLAVWYARCARRRGRPR
jgi:glutathione S-transferase